MCKSRKENVPNLKASLVQWYSIMHGKEEGKFIKGILSSYWIRSSVTAFSPIFSQTKIFYF